jgi:hypothetical protein
MRAVAVPSASPCWVAALLGVRVVGGGLSGRGRAQSLLENGKSGCICVWWSGSKWRCPSSRRRSHLSNALCWATAQRAADFASRCREFIRRCESRHYPPRFSHQNCLLQVQQFLRTLSLAGASAQPLAAPPPGPHLDNRTPPAGRDTCNTFESMAAGRDTCDTRNTFHSIAAQPRHLRHSQHLREHSCPAATPATLATPSRAWLPRATDAAGAAHRLGSEQPAPCDDHPPISAKEY